VKYKQFLQAAAAALFLNTAVALAQDAEAPWNAVRQDNGRAMAQLVTRGTDPNLVNAQGDTLLIAALRDGSGSVVEALLVAPGLKADQANAIGETPLMIAALRGDGGAARRLLDLGAQLNRPGWTPLHYAANGGQVDLVELFIARGAKVDARSRGDVTPLMVAARENHTEVVAVLLKAGADRQARSDRGLRAADFATEGGHDRLAARLAAP
jgi:ankyrin repeat protein